MSDFVTNNTLDNGAEEFEQDEIDKTIEEHKITKGDMESMADLEKDMEGADLDEEENKATSSPKMAAAGSFMPAGAMPTTKNGELSAHAAEFWFPESRNCPCCKGFKHGCKCRVGPITCCQDSGCTSTAPATEEIKVEIPVAKPKPVIVFKQNRTDVPAATPTPTPAPAAATPAASPVAAASAYVPSPIDTSNTGGDNRSQCTFFSSPQGCRFGETCRFKHGDSTPTSGSAQGSPYAGGAPSPSGDGTCRFFRLGTCRNGDNCQFSHS